MNIRVHFICSGKISFRVSPFKSCKSIVFKTSWTPGQKLLTDIFQEIVNLQKDFFNDGYLIPLTEKDISEKLNVSISTVSRAVKGKYLKTPKGLIKVRDLFSRPFSEKISKDYIIGRIKEIIEREKDVSDRGISERLKKEGIKISPRTVNKYRNQAGILNSYLR